MWYGICKKCGVNIEKRYKPTKRYGYIDRVLCKECFKEDRTERNKQHNKLYKRKHRSKLSKARTLFRHNHLKSERDTQTVYRKNHRLALNQYAQQRNDKTLLFATHRSTRWEPTDDVWLLQTANNLSRKEQAKYLGRTLLSVQKRLFLLCKQNSL